jgi:hydrogenase maturation protease
MRTPSSTQTPRESNIASGTVFPRGDRSSSSLDAGHVLVIGYGNPLRGDDGFGWHVARRLIEAGLEHLEIITCHQLTPELAEVIAQAEAVIFVDASLDTPPGEMIVCELEPSAPSRTFTHHLGPTHVLELAHALYGRAPEAKLISVGAVNLGYGERFSLEVEDAIPKVLEEIRRVFVLP